MVAVSDAPQIDDRRRFSDWRKEFLFARVLAPVAAGTAAWGAHRGLLAIFSFFTRSYAYTCFGVLIVGLSLPVMVAKRGKSVFPLAAGLALVSFACAWTGSHFFYNGAPEPELVMGAIVAGIGLAEGCSERSVATMWCGLIGGCFFGAAFAGCFSTVCYLHMNIFTFDLYYWPDTAFGFMMVHWGLFISLALGRWIRDLPKRKQAQDQAMPHADGDIN